MIFVHTGYLLALLNPRDELYVRAQQWATAVQVPLVTTEYILWELVNAFSAPIDRPKVHDAVSAIRGSDDWKVEYATFKLFEEGLLFHRQRPR